MEELKKLDFSNSSSVSTEGNQRSEVSRIKKQHMSSPKKKIIFVLLGIIVLFIIAAAIVAIPAQKTYASAQKTYKQAKNAWEAIKKQNVELAGKEIAATQKDLKETQDNLRTLSYLRFIPLANNYYNDAEHLTNAGMHGLTAATILVDSVKPYADLLGLKGGGSFVMGSAEQRIQTAILTMGKITPRIDDVAQSMVLFQKEVDAVDPNHYPSFFGGDKIKKQLIQLQEITDQSATLIAEARPLIKVLPSLLGESKERKYLILFQNDKELRPTGGFMTAYAVFRIDKGIIHVDRSDDIYTLDNSIRNKPKAPEPLLKYLPKSTVLNIRDTNLSPDFVESMKLFNSLYDKASGKVAVDGIIALDTNVLVNTIRILDDKVEAAGITFTSKEDKRCDCPQVIYELEDTITRPVNYEKTGRKDLLGILLYAIMEKALKSSPKLYWGPLFQDMFEQINQKHVLVYLYNKDAQVGMEALNGAGRIKPFEGDYLHINNANLGGAKSNLFVKDAVNQNIEVGGDGTITKTITISYKNPHPPSDCNLERGGLCLNAVLRDWIRIYVPKGSVLLDSKGSEVKVITSEDLGKTVFEGFLTVKPLGAATYTLKYRLPFKLEGGSPLPLLIQKQPGTYNTPYDITLGGKTVQKFELLTDKEVKLKR